VSLTEENFSHSYLRFGDRQAGIGLVYSPEDERFYYNVYCMEMKILRELFSVEYDYLDDALTSVNEEFGSWELLSFDQKSGCGTCVAK
jgi:hypothetical protein